MAVKRLEYIFNLCYNFFSKGEGEKFMRNGVNVLDIAKIVICKFNNSTPDNSITQLKLQKILYFIEAYYMAMYDKDRLYKEDFFAWTYGPVCKEAYNKYKVFMDLPIEEDCSALPEPLPFDTEITDSIDSVIDIFGSLSATNLIRLTHMQGSPWYNTSKSNKVPINKEETKKWFKGLFLSDGKEKKSKK